MKYKKVIGIYTILNLNNHKLYVGYSNDCRRRFTSHILDFSKNKHRNPYLQRAWNKYGITNFKFEILEECEEQFLASQENYWCNLLDTHNPKFGYNIRGTSPDGKMGHSESTKLKIGEANKGHKHTEEWKKVRSELYKGKSWMPKDYKHSSEIILKIKEGVKNGKFNKGSRKFDEKTINRIRKFMNNNINDYKTKIRVYKILKTRYNIGNNTISSIYRKKSYTKFL